MAAKDPFPEGYGELLAEAKSVRDSGPRWR